MENNFLTYSQSFKLIELGFEEQCFGFYNNADGNIWIKQNIPKEIIEIYRGDIIAPLKQQAFKFFREKYGLYAHFFSKEDDTFLWCIRWYVYGVQKDTPYFSVKTYELAESDCIDELIILAKNKNNEK